MDKRCSVSPQEFKSPLVQQPFNGILEQRCEPEGRPKPLQTDIESVDLIFITRAMDGWVFFAFVA